MFENNYFEPDIISKREELYNKVINSKVVDMIRYGLEAKEEFSKIYNIENNRRAFSLSEGALVIEFDCGISLAFNSDEELCSLMSWAERLNDQYSKEPLKNVSDLFPIKANDSRYSSEFIGNIINNKLVKYEIIKQEPYSPTYYSLPREVGLVLYFSNGNQLIISHQLTKEVSDNFTILEWSEVDIEIYKTLYKTSRYWG